MQLSLLHTFIYLFVFVISNSLLFISCFSFFYFSIWIIAMFENNLPPLFFSFFFLYKITCIVPIKNDQIFFSIWISISTENHSAALQSLMYVYCVKKISITRHTHDTHTKLGLKLEQRYMLLSLQYTC